VTQDANASSKDALLPFLPLLYVGWADGHLDSEELRSIFRRALDLWTMTPADRELVGRLLDPDRPPSRLELDQMLERIRSASSDLDSSDRRSLSDYGVALARISGGVSAAEERALRELELAIGGSGTASARQALGPGGGG
jgi:acyl-CoA oxidase